MSQFNPEIDQDRTADLVETFKRYGVIMFRQQRAIYRYLARALERSTVVEVGCGLGTGSAMICQEQLLSEAIVATDKIGVNVCFAKETYPWITFEVWDPTRGPTHFRADAVVAVEVLEHVADPVTFLRNCWTSAEREMWISTPNGAGKPRPPSNPFHVQEYTPEEVLRMLCDLGADPLKVDVFGWEDFSPQGLDTLVDPLVYRVKR